MFASVGNCCIARCLGNFLELRIGSVKVEMTGRNAAKNTDSERSDKSVADHAF